MNHLGPSVSRTRLLACMVFAASLCGCAGGADRLTRNAPEKVADGWPVASPEAFGADIEQLAAMVDRIEAGEYVNIHSVLVIKEGRLVLEHYFEGDRSSPHEIRSATKSIGSILVGMAIDRGVLTSENEPISSYFEDYEPAGGWNGPARTVEIRHLLSMTSGYDCDDLTTQFACEHAMHDADDWVQYALALPFAYPPGEHWAYNSSSLSLVGEAVARSSGMKLEEFADRFLFAPLGVEAFQWQFSPKGRAWIGGGARMVPREMAKIGQLMANRGMWNGRRLVSESWITKSTAKQSDPRNGVDYGYLWQSGEAYIGQELVRAFWASGNGGQYIIVLPEQRMVVVFTGGNFDSPLASQPFHLLTRFILPSFIRPSAPQEVFLEEQALSRLAGSYRLDVEPAAGSTITVADNRLRLRSPDGEDIDLTPMSPHVFTGESHYGAVTLVFEADALERPRWFKAYGSFQRFRFDREE